MATIARRQAAARCTMLACLFAMVLHPSLADAKPRPFCGYSLSKGWFGKPGSTYVTRQAGPSDASGIPQVIARIYKVLDIAPDIDVYLAEKEDNAFATVAGGKKIIVVDVGFVEEVNRRAKTKWGAIHVIAHELGHHIAGFSSDRHRGELNADYWSGQVLQRLGAARQAATMGILAVGTTADTSTHPGKHKRATIIEQGWDDAKAGKIDYSFCDGCK